MESIKPNKDIDITKEQIIVLLYGLEKTFGKGTLQETAKRIYNSKLENIEIGRIDKDIVSFLKKGEVEYV